MSLPTVMERIEHERQRQILKGFTAAHDDQHVRGELALAGAVIILRAVWSAAVGVLIRMPDWVAALVGKVQTKYHDSIDQQIVIGVAMILAELERRERLKIVPESHAAVIAALRAANWNVGDQELDAVNPTQIAVSFNRHRRRMIQITEKALIAYISGEKITASLEAAGLPDDLVITSICFTPRYVRGDSYLVLARHASFGLVPVGEESPIHPIAVC